MSKVVIFGATGGMGTAITKKLAGNGYDLQLVGRNRDQTQALAEKFHAGFTIGDVLDQDLFHRVSEDLPGEVGGLVYAVGTLNLKSLSRVTEEDLLHDFRVNAVGAALAVKALSSQLKKNPDGPSSVVFFSTVAVNQGFKLHTSISMAKAAVEGLTRSLAAELAPKVRVNAIAPSLTRTPLATGLLGNEKMAEAIAKLHAMERLGSAEDMAALCAFLISPDSSWITGQVFGVDGGRSTLRNKS